LNRELKDAVKRFADENGWKVKITDSGIRAIFRKNEP
jgi:hypothetical protein